MTTRLADLAPLDRLRVLSYARQQGTLTQFAPTAVIIPDHQRPEAIDPSLGGTLVALAALDDAATTILGRSSVYLLRDETLAKLLCSPTPDLCILLESLAVAGLTYRFPAATKFGYAPAIVQVRISAWGRSVANTIVSAVREYAFGVAAETFSQHAKTYAELLRACDAPHPLPTQVIHTLNHQVPIPIVT